MNKKKRNVKESCGCNQCINFWQKNHKFYGILENSDGLKKHLQQLSKIHNIKIETFFFIMR